MNYKFSAKDQKQIAMRFETMFKVLTAKTWVKGHGGVEADGVRVIGWQDVPRLGDPDTPKMKSLCLMGAVRHVDGPTEEEITALIATQIVMEHGNTVLQCYDTAGLREITGRDDISKGEEALLLFENLVLDQDVGAGIVIYFNDNISYSFKDVKKMLLRAQSLYDKLWLVWKARKAMRAKVEGIKIV